MTEIEQQKLILEDLIMKSLTIDSDETEGTLVLNLKQDVNLCDPDNNGTTKSPMSPEEIVSLLHFNDPNVSPSAGNDDDGGLNKGNGKDDDTSNLDNSNGDNTSDSSTGIIDEERKKIEDDFKKYNDIQIPDDANIDDIVNAIINDDTIGQNRAIVEFGQPCIRDEKGVDYQFLVKPGQSLTQDTIIANATINGVNKPVRSIFSKGTVMAINDNQEFKRLYPSHNADRHIIIENFEYCGDAPEISTDMIDKATDKFKTHAYLYQLIIDNIAECILPSILLKRYDSYIFGINMRWRPNGRELYGDYLEDVVKPIREGYQNDMKNLASEDKIRSCNGNTKKLKERGNDIIDRRNYYAEQMIWCYNTARLQIDKSEYDPDYSDCKYLGADKDIPEGSRITYTKIGEKEYNNYYLALLSKVNITVENEWSQKYFDLLKGIIEKRIALEKYSLNDIIGEFNSQFRSQLNATISNAWYYIDEMMKSKNGDGTIGDVISWISENANQAQASSYASMTYQQMANIYMFVYKYSPYKIVNQSKGRSTLSSEEQEEEPSLYELVEEEWNKIKTFWDAAIIEYHNHPLSDCIASIKDIPSQIEKYHHWPAATTFQIGYDSFDHYVFMNTKEMQHPSEDEDMGNDYDSNVPTIPTAMDAPPEQPLSSLNDNQIDPTEPTIKDFDYWVRYFSLATVISLPYLNCGLDIPGVIMMVPLPCIFICVGSVYIQILDIVIVFGISIRGMYIWPIVLFVNLGNMTASILTPLISQVKSLISKISAKINSLAEKPITALAVGFINMIEEDNKKLRKENKQLDIYISQIKVKKVKNQEKIRKITWKSLVPKANLKQQVVNPIQSMYAKENNK